MTQTSHTKNYNMPRLFLMFLGIEYDFWLLRVWIPEAVSGNCLVTNGLREVWLLCCFDVRWTCLPVLASGGFRYFKGHFRTRWCLRCVFCSVMHHCVVRRSGSVPTEITEPPWRLDRPDTYSSKHCKAKTSRQAYWSAAISRSQPSGCILLGSQKSYWKPCHIRNSLGTIYFLVWEVWVIKYPLCDLLAFFK